MGADELATMMSEPSFVASVGYFPERYGNFLVPMALAELAGIDLPPTVLMTHVMVDKGNICNYYPDFKCEGTSLELAFPQEAFVKHLEDIRKSPDMADALDLIPTE
jgi:ribose transport system substrate-binding protein